LAVARWPTESTPAELLELAMALKKEASELTADQLEELRLLSVADMDSATPFAGQLAGQPTLRWRVKPDAFALIWRGGSQPVDSSAQLRHAEQSWRQEVLTEATQLPTVCAHDRSDALADRFRYQRLRAQH
jgi:hypothetical protein